MRWKAKLPIIILSAAISSGCAIQGNSVKPSFSEPPKENRIVSIKAQDSIQFISSLIAERLNVNSIEWSNTTNPWEYKALRSSELNIDENSIQDIFSQVFEGTGLVAFYNEENNRVLVERFRLQDPDSIIFERKQNLINTEASDINLRDAKIAEAKQVKDLLKKQKELDDLKKTFSIPKGGNVRKGINAWLRSEGITTTLWYLTDKKTMKRIEQPLESRIDFKAINAQAAISELITTLKLENEKNELFQTRDIAKNTVVIHQLGENAPLKVVAISQGSLIKNIDKLASQMGWSVKLKGVVDRRVPTPHAMVITQDIESNIDRLIKRFGLVATYSNSAQTIYVKDA